MQRFATREAVRSLFRERFGSEDLMVRAPGRVNIVGEHTDYNGGLALPAAVDRSVWLALKRNRLERIRIEAPALHKSYDGPLAHAESGPGPWPRFVLGVIEILREAGATIGGFDLVYDTDIPMGSGLSSSGALACGLAFALRELFELPLSVEQLCEAARRTEVRYVGTQSGALDQTAILFGKRGHALLLDFRDLSRNAIPVPNSIQLVLCDSGTERAAAESRYNERRSECIASLRILQQHKPSMRSLRDASDADLDACADELGHTLLRRCRYVRAENARVADASTAFITGDLDALGRLIFASHEGLRNDYQVSRPEIDRLVAHASQVDGIVGARMMGTGFGGSTINLVRADHAASFIEAMRRYNRETMQRDGRIFTIVPSAGVARVA